ncbi:MAG: SRPBCC family protein [Phaeodactylibacter sp.]|nr:SRPBCC family protein [Phaeodactylibacter sp.]MCB9301994.1 SRPBCC family protein [Lewinellaceae bacterium]
MRALKIILVVLAALLGIFLLLGLIAPKEVSTSQSIVVNAPPQVAFNVVNDLTTWDSWSPWKENDPTIANVMGEITAGEGAYFTWTSENSGNGKMTITESQPNESIKMVVDFDGQGAADGPFTFKAVDNGTEVTWGFYSKFPFPWNAMLLFQDFQKGLEKDYQRGLELLKGVVEEKAKTMASSGNLQVQEIDAPARYFLGVRETVAMNGLKARFEENFPKVFEAVSNAGLEMAGMPSALYYTWDEAKQSTDLAFVIPLKEKGQLKGFESFELPAGKALLVNFYGDYSKIGDAHTAIDQYLAANSLEASAPVIEEYVTDPQSEPDPANWLTRVYYPLKK